MPLPLDDFGVAQPEGDGGRRRRPRCYIIEVTTRTGKLSERFTTYEAALARIGEIPEESIVGLPLIFKELPDGSCRAVRLDEKPLQFHRLEDEPIDEAPLPLTDIEPTGKPIIVRELP